MNSTDIVGYAYDAAMHCPDCAAKHGADKPGAIDSEGNAVTPVFCGEDAVEQPCDDCGAYLMDDKPAEQHCIVDGCFGIYVPTRFATKFRNNDAYCVLNVTPADWDELEKGPDEPDYWELWDEIYQAAEIIDNESGKHYTLEQDGDLFMVEK